MYLLRNSAHLPFVEVAFSVEDIDVDDTILSNAASNPPVALCQRATLVLRRFPYAFRPSAVGAPCYEYKRKKRGGGQRDVTDTAMMSADDPAQGTISGS